MRDKVKSNHRLAIIRRSYQRLGFWRTIAVAGRMVRSRLQRRQIYFCLSTCDVANLPTISIHGYRLEGYRTWREVGEKVRRFLSKNIRFIGKPPKQFLDGGAALWVGFVDDEPACCVWTQTGDLVEEFFFPIATNDVLFTRGFTSPSYRGRGTLSATLSGSIRELEQNGIRSFYAGCLDWNESSRKSMERAGFRFAGYGTGLGTRHVTWHQKERPCLNPPTAGYSSMKNKTGTG